MKNLALFFLTLVLVSGCASTSLNSLNRDNYGKVTSGSIKIYSKDKVSDINKENIPSYSVIEINENCNSNDFRILSIEKSDRFLGFLFYLEEYNLKFECINDSKK